MSRVFGFLKGIIFSRLFLYIVGMLVAAFLIWFIGPLIGIGDQTPLATALQRMLAITLMPAILGLGAIFSNFRSHRTNTQLQQQLSETPESKARAARDAASAEEVSDLGAKLTEAMDLLKKTKVRRTWGNGWLYEIPWYMFIGPPGSGKTTALTNSGLNFPLADSYGKKAVRGVGGTRSCDWWFTDEAVLIDTAGRYTTQDSEAQSDSGAWSGFLKLLKKSRKRQPINGAIVAIGLSDLLEWTEDKRVEHARSIRERLKELYAELSVPFTVYVMLTKADRIAGFVEFFDDLNREERDQVWGITFDPDAHANEGGTIATYRAEFDALMARLNDRLLERIQRETDPQRRARIFGFPQQMASLAELTDTFLRAVFQPNRYEKPARLRGVYFSSGTQQGTPIDRLMHAMAANFGISTPQVSPLGSSGRSYFLTKLMRDVVFGEAGLVSADSKFEKRNRLIRRIVLSGAAASILLMTGSWTTTYFYNADLVAEVERNAAKYDEQAKSLKLDRVADSDLRAIVPLLDNLRDMPGGYAKRFDNVPLLLQLGLYQGNKLGSQAILVYRRALNGLLLPRMLVRLESQLAQNQDRPDFLYQALKVYLMLGPEGRRIDKSVVEQWMALDWAVQYPGPEYEKTRDALAGHLHALLEKPLAEIPIDTSLVERTRSILAVTPAAERAYATIKADPKVTALQPWRISENAGPAVGRVLLRKSGLSLAEGIPGLYTHDGYFFGFRPLLPTIADRMAQESWVLGMSGLNLGDRVAIARLQREVTSLYLTDFAAQWDRLLADITTVRFTTPAQRLEVLNVLAAPDSPLRLLMLNAASETKLSRPPASAQGPNGTGPSSTSGLGNAAAAAAQQAAQIAAQRAIPGAARGAVGAQLGQTINQQQEQLAGLLGANAVLIEDTAGPYTDQHFKALHTMVGAPSGGGNGPGGGAAAIDTIITDLNAVYVAMLRAGPAAAAGTGVAGGDVATAMGQLNADTGRLPDFARPIVASVTQQNQAIDIGNFRKDLNDGWNASVAQFCSRALDNRYPFSRAAVTEITLDDFTRLFAKGGLIDSFFNTNLRQHVDISKDPWTWQPSDNPGTPATALIQFRNAAIIRDNMFAGGTSPHVSFDLVMTNLDQSSNRVVVELDGQTATYEKAQPKPVKLNWPGNLGHVRISFEPQKNGEATTIEKDGSWAWFRVLLDNEIKQTSAQDRYNVTIKTGNRSATFDLHTSSVDNPFSPKVLNALQGFRCLQGF